MFIGCWEVGEIIPFGDRLAGFVSNQINDLLIGEKQVLTDIWSQCCIDILQYVTSSLKNIEKK